MTCPEHPPAPGHRADARALGTANTPEALANPTQPRAPPQAHGVPPHGAPAERHRVHARMPHAAPLADCRQKEAKSSKKALSKKAIPSDTHPSEFQRKMYAGVITAETPSALIYPSRVGISV